MGKIVVIEGTDFSGKTTQYEKLKARFEREGVEIGTDSFPNYDEESSYFVRAYLHGEFGEKPTDVDSKIASSFYTLDRYASFKKHKWGEIYRAGGNVLFSRYIASNVIHQASKIKDPNKQLDFIDWLYDYEYNMYHLPKEDCVILLDMPFKMIEELKQKRLKEQHGLTSSGTEKDIHEKDLEYLRNAHGFALAISENMGWNVVSCVDSEGKLRSIDDIHEEVYDIASFAYGLRGPKISYICD